MYELNQEVFLRYAKQDHPRLLKESKEAHFINSAIPYTPNLWDKITLILGNWLIDLGCSLKSRSFYTRLSEKHA